MDMSLVTSIMSAQAGNTQMQVAATIMQQNDAAEKSTVQTLLGTGSQSGSSLANVAAGVGGNLDISA
jgi:hypothetical protein